MSHDLQDESGGRTTPRPTSTVQGDPAATPRPADSGLGPAPPSLWNQAVSFAQSMARFAASGFQTVDAEIHQARRDRCEPCEYRRETRCAVCGCFLDKKAWLPHEDCPIGRWPV